MAPTPCKHAWTWKPLETQVCKLPPLSMYVFYLLPGASHMLSRCLVHCYLEAVIFSCLSFQLGIAIVAQHVLLANVRHQQIICGAGELTDAHLCGLTCASRTSGQAQGAHGFQHAVALQHDNSKNADRKGRCQGLRMCLARCIAYRGWHGNRGR